MTYTELEINGAYSITPRIFNDERGWFKESYNKKAFAEIGITDEFVQDNESFSSRGVLRGLHYQLPPCAQAKLIKVLQGTILDVFVDIRKDSPTFGKHAVVELSAEDHTMLYVPAGCAHGFVVKSDTAHIQYKVNNGYAPEHERGVLWNDPALGINWGVEDPIVAQRDTTWPLLADIPQEELF